MKFLHLHNGYHWPQMIQLCKSSKRTSSKTLFLGIEIHQTSILRDWQHGPRKEGMLADSMVATNGPDICMQFIVAQSQVLQTLCDHKIQSLQPCSHDKYAIRQGLIPLWAIAECSKSCRHRQWHYSTASSMYNSVTMQRKALQASNENSQQSCRRNMRNLINCHSAHYAPVLGHKGWMQ